MTDKMPPKEPEHVSCDICMKEVPIDEASSFAAVNYVINCCGLDCFSKWKEKIIPSWKMPTRSQILTKSERPDLSYST